MTDVSQVYVDEFRDFAGLRTPALIHSAGDADAFIRRVPGGAFCTLVDNTMRRNADRALAFRFGAAIGGRGFGLLGVATAAAPSLLHSLHSLLRWEPLTSTLGQASLQHSGRQVRVLWTPEPGTCAAVIEGVLAGWVAFGRFLLGEAVPVSALEVCHADDGHRAEAQALLGCPVIFGAARNAVIFPAELLDARPRYTDAVLHARLAGWLDDCVRVIGQQRESPLLHVGGIILQGLAWGDSAKTASPNAWAWPGAPCSAAWAKPASSSAACANWCAPASPYPSSAWAATASSISPSASASRNRPPSAAPCASGPAARRASSAACSRMATAACGAGTGRGYLRCGESGIRGVAGARDVRIRGTQGIQPHRSRRSRYTARLITASIQ